MRHTCRPLLVGRRHACGVMLLGLLLMLMLTSIAVMAAAEVWSTTRQRERETELLFAGDQYLQAIRHYYYAAPPGQGRMLPARLENLLNDDRFPVPVRHLRRLYPDPITGSSDWGLVLINDRVAGVHSLSDAVPLKQAGFAATHAGFEAKQSYQEWVFLFVPPRTLRATPRK
jgi:type II secretory pathway pseudopilin PulG